MTEMDETSELLRRLADHADKHFDGHFTIMKFTTNWRVGFGTPNVDNSFEDDAVEMWGAKTFAEAARMALAMPRHVTCVTRHDVKEITAEDDRRHAEICREIGLDERATPNPWRRDD